MGDNGREFEWAKGNAIHMVSSFEAMACNKSEAFEHVKIAQTEIMLDLLDQMVDRLKAVHRELVNLNTDGVCEHG